MTTEMLTLCYSARPSPNGELHILGATDIIFVPQFPIGISNLQIPHAGEYEIGLAVNGRQEMTVPLFIRQPPATTPGQGPS
jgi:hypothetical protein